MEKFIEIKKIKKINIYNKNIIVSDFETIIINKKHYVYAIGIKHNINNQINDWYMFIKDSINTDDFIKKSDELLYDFINYLNKISQKKKCYVYFHNLKGFDGIFIIKILSKYYANEKKNILIKNNCIYKIVYKNITFLDTFNIISESLNNIAKIFLGKEKNKFNISSIKKISDISSEYVSIKIYLKQDVDILYDIVYILLNKFYDLFQIDITNHITVSSISYSIYRMWYLKADLYKIEILNKFREKFVRQAYYGGLCCVLETIMGKGYYYDVNSLYPSVMKDNYYPSGKGEYIYFNKNNRYVKDKYLGYLECIIYIPKKIKIPPICFRQDNGRLIQAHGYLKGVWFTKEIDFAIEKGCVLIKVYKVLHYNESVKMFDNFVEDLYNKRMNSNNSIDKKLYKNILNSLYGRFGIRMDETFFVWDENSDDDCLYEYFSFEKNIFGENKEIIEYEVDHDLYKNIDRNNLTDEEYLKINKLYHSSVLIKSIKGNSVHIAAAISSYARIKLLKDIYYIYDYYNNDVNIYYYDTDSIILNKELPLKMIDEKMLGKYKLENNIIRGIFIAPKTYYLEVQDKKKDIKKIRKWKSLNAELKDKMNYDFYKKCLNKNFENIILLKNSPINKKIKMFEIIEQDKKYTINFGENDKYEKIYDDNEDFIKTKPLYIEKNEIEKE